MEPKKEIGWVEAAVATLDDTRLSPDERMDVVTLISGHIRNTQAREVAGTQPWHDRDYGDLLRLGPQQFPALHQLASGRTRTPRQSRVFGLRCVLDGVETALGRAEA